MRRTLLLLLSSFALVACAPSELPPPSAPPSISTPSGYSQSLGSQVDSGVSLAVPQRTVSADLVVRPDIITQSFAIKETDLDPQKAVALAQGTVNEVTKAVQKAAGGGAIVKMCGVTITPFTRDKALAKGQKSAGKPEDMETAYSVTVDGSIEIKLAPDLDYWARSKLIAGLSQATKEIADAARAAAQKDGSHDRGTTFAEMKPAVRDPEALRGKLTERWVQRARSFAEAAQASAAPLTLGDCVPPGQIEQKIISFEEIGLSLGFNCKIEAGRSGKDRAP